MSEFTHQNGLTDGIPRGRAAGLNPANRFETTQLHIHGEHWDRQIAEQSAQALSRPKTRSTQRTVRPAATGHALINDQQVPTEVLTDHSRTVINRVDSPDLGFHWTLNPYRGCEHGCIYCYARPTHEYLGLSSGLDFETKILAKPEAPTLLQKHLADPRWQPETIVLSGVTDPYQPVESKLEITRRCLEVFARTHHPVSIVTKSRLILRDLGLLQELARVNAVRVSVSITTLDSDLAARMEPRAACPRDRLWVVRRLASAGIPVTVMVAPIIPGLNDRDTATVLKAAAEAGADQANFVLLRLPHQIKALFEEWVNRQFPDRAAHILSLIRQTRDGKLYDARWGTRHRGTGAYAEQISKTFRLFARRYNLNQNPPELNTAAFRRPGLPGEAQLSLFAEH